MPHVVVSRPWILDPSACLCEPIAFEVLRHATPQERVRIEDQFSTLALLPSPQKLWRDAVHLGQQCRKGCFTAGFIDLLIATIAIHHSAELVTFDSDYAAIADHSALKVRLLERPDLPLM